MIKRPLRYFRKAIFHIQKEGLIAFIKATVLIFKNIISKAFLCENHIIFQKNLNDAVPCFAPKVKNYDFKILSTTQGLHDLQKSGFSINPPFDISAFCERLDQGQIAFCIFIDKDLAYSCWAVVNKNVSNKDLRLKYINFEKDAYGWYDTTAPRYRRLGLHTYGSFKRLEYLKYIGKSRVVLTILKDNEPAIKVQKKLGCEICGEGKYLRLFGRAFWKEKSIGNHV